MITHFLTTLPKCYAERTKKPTYPTFQFNVTGYKALILVGLSNFIEPVHKLPHSLFTLGPEFAMDLRFELGLKSAIDRKIMIMIPVCHCLMFHFHCFAEHSTVFVQESTVSYY